MSIVKEVQKKNPNMVKDIKLKVLDKLGEIKYEYVHEKEDYGNKVDEAEFKIKVELVNISKIVRGDTVLYKNKETTVGKKDIKKSADGDWTLFGDSFKAGKDKVERVLFQVTRGGKSIGFAAQP